MKKIVKQSEPKSLTEHRLKPHSNYGNYVEKDELRDYQEIIDPIA